MASRKNMRNESAAVKITDFLTRKNVKNANAPSQPGHIRQGTNKDDGTSRKTLQTLQVASDNKSLTRQSEKKEKAKKRKNLDGEDSVMSPAKRRNKTKRIIPTKNIVVYQDENSSPSESRNIENLARDAASTPVEQRNSENISISSETLSETVKEEAVATTELISTETQTDAYTCTCQLNKDKAGSSSSDKTMEQESSSSKAGDEIEDAELEAMHLMGGDSVPEDYWKQIAEERRNALNDTLEENEQLHQEIQDLKEANQSLSELAGQAEYFASMLKMLTEDEEKKEEKEAEESGDEHPSQKGESDEDETKKDSEDAAAE